MTGPLPTAASLYRRVQHIIPPMEWSTFADDVDAILALKRGRNAVILAHNYQTPEIFHCVADIVGDSLALARKAMTVDADVIVLAGVHFMAETAKLLNPGKRVLIPDLGAGCSLADSITADDVRLMRQRYPGVPIVTYVNTSAAVKAQSDILAIAGDIRTAVERARAAIGHMVKLEVEVDTLDQLETALSLGVDAVLLDNMSVGQLTRAVAMVEGRATTEASGRITATTAPAIAATGVDLISVGWLTHSAPILDIGMDVPVDAARHKHLN